MWRFAFSVVILFALCTSCGDLLEYSPNQVFDKDSPVGINARNLDSLVSRPGDDTVTLVFIGDSQRFYDELEAFIDKVNSIPSIDFVLLAGDISDFGLLEEFEQIEDRLSALNKPYIGVVGNHDVQARGSETFERMFGPLNFTFTYKGIKFIAHNTNSREYADGTVPDMQWLTSAFTKEPGVEYFIPISHIPPFASDFEESLEPAYRELMRKNKVLISLHGHVHEHLDGYPYEDGIRYMTSHSFNLRNFILLKVFKGQVTHEIIEY